MILSMDRKQYNLAFVPKAEVAIAWGGAQPFLLPAIERFGEMTEQQVLWHCLNGTYSLWLTYDGDEVCGAVVIEIINYPKRRVAYFAHFGGNFNAMIMHLDKIESWAVSRGASALLINGRKGWLKRMRPFGFIQKYVTMEKPLWVEAQETQPPRLTLLHSSSPRYSN